MRLAIWTMGFSNNKARKWKGSASQESPLWNAAIHRAGACYWNVNYSMGFLFLQKETKCPSYLGQSGKLVEVLLAKAENFSWFRTLSVAVGLSNEPCHRFATCAQIIDISWLGCVCNTVTVVIRKKANGMFYCLPLSFKAVFFCRISFLSLWLASSSGARRSSMILLGNSWKWSRSEQNVV